MKLNGTLLSATKTNTNTSYLTVPNSTVLKCVCVRECGGSGGSDALPLHQVLHFAVVGDAARQDTVLFPARHAPGRAEVAADGAPEEAELSA